MQSAATRRRIASLKRRIERDSKPAALDEFGDTLLHLAVEHKDMDAVRAFLEAGESLEIRDAAGQTPLGKAIACQDVDTVRMLTEANVSLECRDSFGRTPLFYTLESGMEEATQVLLDAGADANSEDTLGNTPLHWTAGRGTVEVASLLKARGADLDARNRSGMTPLHTAAMVGEWDLVKLFVELGASLNARDHSGKTALHKAAQTGRLSAIEVLTNAGADVHAVDREGSTAHQLAKAQGFDTVARCLEQRSIEAHTQQDTPSEEANVAVQIDLTGQSSAPAQQDSSYAASVDQTDLSEQVVSGVSDSDSSSQSYMINDAIRAVQELRQNDKFADAYVLDSGCFIGKPLVRTATSLDNDEKVVLKFYDDLELFQKSVITYRRVNKSKFVCKPTQKVNAHAELPNCFVFKKGSCTLDEWIHYSDLTLGNKRDTLELIAAALEELHAHDIVHCDIKPANLAFFPLEHKWKILDMDSARDVGEKSNVMMTIPYAAPEILLTIEAGGGEMSLRTSADMWAYGIIAYEILTGERFYNLDDITAVSLLRVLRTDWLERRLKRVEDSKQRRFVKKFLHWNPDERATATAACVSSFFAVASSTTSTLSERR